MMQAAIQDMHSFKAFRESLSTCAHSSVYYCVQQCASWTPCCRRIRQEQLETNLV